MNRFTRFIFYAAATATLIFMAKNTTSDDNSKSTTPIGTDHLVREWVEIREESQEGRIVLRPMGYDIPPARGRRWLDLSIEGTAQVKSPDATDKMEGKGGTWSLQDDNLSLEIPGWTGSYRIEQLDEDILVISPKNAQD